MDKLPTIVRGLAREGVGSRCRGAGGAWGRRSHQEEFFVGLAEEVVVGFRGVDAGERQRTSGSDQRAAWGLWARAGVATGGRSPGFYFCGLRHDRSASSSGQVGSRASGAGARVLIELICAISGR